ncbi:MAG TPA: biotin carboxylase N-terminal domain-containing protein [Desulfuromonadales bacterium]|nr:biotin carboxylase N-terminal domain-containing protein [Desulfuromonadales bacterium]
MFTKLLIANRGEIACRILRTARRLGVASVAVYSDADRDALHVALADEAYRLGPPPPAESYLKIDTLVEIARKSGAGAVHPGYGFLAENAAFAEACEAAGLAFVGPPPAAIRAMGLKSEARRLVAEAGVPLVPGFFDPDQSPQRLHQAAAELGFPVLIKASAGGGGKGMRVVHSAKEFDRALESCRREAATAFGDDAVLVEKFLPGVRHIEVQIFADRHGNAVHLFERDCSLQRRYQKIIEESPAPGITADLRQKLGETALAAARAAGYLGAGTVEFLLAADGAFYFNEMNTRLQVEHPVTELITGIDLVEWQLRVAAGEPLPLRQEEISLHGHAIEARLCAEDPSRDFLPATGKLEALHFPAESAHLRIDTGVRQGDRVAIHYDPLLAKLLALGDDREEARRRLQRLLGETLVAGVTTNLDFLAAVLAHPGYAKAEIDTGFIERHRPALFPAPGPAPAEAKVLAALFLLLCRTVTAKEAASASADPWSPWHRTDGWRLNGGSCRPFTLRDGEEEFTVVLRRRQDGWLAEVAHDRLAVEGALTESGEMAVEIAGRRVSARAAVQAAELTLLFEGRRYRFGLGEQRGEGHGAENAGGRLTAPMPGRVLAVLVEPGARVRRGEPLLVLEAMKMEHTIAAPADGVVKEVHFQAGQQVEEGARLMSMESAGEKSDATAEKGQTG